MGYKSLHTHLNNFNVFITKPDKHDWFLAFNRASFGFVCYYPNQPTTGYGSCLDLALDKNVAQVVSKPIMCTISLTM